jgi:tRNA threonylcarbamoyladenosine biosynthesis protein TsaB
MLNALALDTSTDACSVAMQLGGVLNHRHELVPRQHNQRLFTMLREILPPGHLADSGLELLAFNHGPGSFTGLRIAASAIQGLAYATGLPAVGVSTLACLAQGAWRKDLVSQADTILVLLDARINEVYWGLYEFRDGLAHSLCADAVAAPGELPAQLASNGSRLVALGSGLAFLEALPQSLQQQISATVKDVWPDSLDTLTLAELEQREQRLLEPVQVQPVYLRNEIHWKKLSEQG